jgi:hypothetical protein
MQSAATALLADLFDRPGAGRIMLETAGCPHSHALAARADVVPWEASAVASSASSFAARRPVFATRLRAWHH